MRRGMKKLHGLKAICYAACLIDLNEYLAVSPRAKISDKICVKELNEMFLNCMPDSWIKKEYLH